MSRSVSDSSSVPTSPNPAAGTPMKQKNPTEEASELSYMESSPVPAISVGKLVVNLGRKESYKMQRQNYRFEKKRATREVLSTLNDPTVVVLADWLKVRGTLKSWTKLWCILKPGLLLLYKSDKAKSSHWVGTILLSTCKLIERPSKKDGFCFKLFNPLEQSIWAPKGPQGENIPAVVQPLPTSHLIFRAPSQGAGKCWMDALELAVRCSSLLMRSMSTKGDSSGIGETAVGQDSLSGNPTLGSESSQVNDLLWNDTDYEKHFRDHEKINNQFLSPFWRQSNNTTPSSYSSSQTPSPLTQKTRRAFRVPSKFYHTDLDDASHTDEAEGDQTTKEASDETDQKNGNRDSLVRSTESDSDDDFQPLDDALPAETTYTEDEEEELGFAGEQTEELGDANKNLVWFLVKQVRPGMDLSRVVLPTFILEPRSFLDKLSDYYYHADIISRAVLEDDPFTRMKTVVQWYLSGFYKKPKGLKKPYNPILGEVFRCCWKHPGGSRTFYIAEQVSHHPPVSAFYVTNREEGFALSATIFAKSKFYGNSLSAILDGSARLTLLPRGEDYIITMPYAHCKGILLGTLSMELGGEVSLECEKTGYRTELEFKLKPMLGGSEFINYVTGKLKLGKETLATISGYWDGCVNIEDKRTGEKQVLWNPSAEVRGSRLKRRTVPLEVQQPFESAKLWQKVSAAIRDDNQELATEEKTILEEAQRAATKARLATRETWVPRCFDFDPVTGVYQYRNADYRPWDPRNDVLQFESNLVIATKTRHKTPMIRAASIVNVELQSGSLRQLASVESRQRLTRENLNLNNGSSAGTGPGSTELRNRHVNRGSASRTADLVLRHNYCGSVSSSAEGEQPHSEPSEDENCRGKTSQTSWLKIVKRLDESHSETVAKLTKIQHYLESVAAQQQRQNETLKLRTKDLFLFAVLMAVVQAVIFWVLLR